MMERMRTTLVLLSLLALSGCMTERVPPFAEHPSIPKLSTFLVKKISYDSHGRPLLGDRLDSRPGSAGEQFTVVQTINGRPSQTIGSSKL